MLKWILKTIYEWLFLPNQIESVKKRERISNHVRNTVWEKYHGSKNQGNCYCCNIKVNRYNAGWHCSHVQSDTKGGSNTVDNLRVCCAGCNLSMGDQNMYAFIRDKKLKGPGSKNVSRYMKQHPNQCYDVRNNNWNSKK
jgi:hypothetical protein